MDYLLRKKRKEQKMKWFYYLMVVLAMGLASCNSSGDRWDSTKYDPEQEEVIKDVPTSDIPPGGDDVDYGPNRVIWQKPELVLSLLDTLKGKTVADIGAGMGFFTFPLLPLAKKVIAIDIDPFFLHHIDSVKVANLIPQDRNRLETRLAKTDKIPLKEQEIDAAVIVNTFMFIPNHITYLKELLEKLKPGGTLLIVDFKKRKLPLGPEQAYKIPLYVVEGELYDAGFRSVKAYDMLLEYQYILVARKGE